MGRSAGAVLHPGAQREGNEKEPPPADRKGPRFPVYLVLGRNTGERGGGGRGEQRGAELVSASASAAEMQDRRLRAPPSPPKETRKGPGSQASAAVLARLRDQADFLLHESCAPWHALSARQGPGACLPRGCPRRWPISAGTGGPSHASPLPTPAEHSWIPDKGARAGEGQRRSVCFLPAGSVPATLGFSKSLAQCAEPCLARIWPSQATLLVFYLSLAPVQSLSWQLREALGAVGVGQPSRVARRKLGSQREAAFPKPHDKRWNRELGVFTARWEKHPRVPRATLLPCAMG